MTVTGLEPRTTQFVNEHSTIWPNWVVWPNGWVFVYQLSDSGFESSCSHLRFSLFALHSTLLTLCSWKDISTCLTYFGLVFPLYSSGNTRKPQGISFKPQACNFIKKETLAQVFSYEFSEISKNTFFHRTPLVATSIIRVLKKFAKFTEKHLCWNLSLINLQSWRQLLSATLLKKWLQHRRFSGNVVKFLRTSFLQKTFGGCFCSRKKPLNFSEKH